MPSPCLGREKWLWCYLGIKGLPRSTWSTSHGWRSTWYLLPCSNEADWLFGSCLRLALQDGCVMESAIDHHPSLHSVVSARAQVCRLAGLERLSQTDWTRTLKRDGSPEFCLGDLAGTFMLPPAPRSLFRHAAHFDGASFDHL